MSASDTPSTQDRTDASRPESADAVAATELYETDAGVVLYDSHNPLAWIQARSTLRLDEMD